jgi:hypothetical protein
MAAKIVASQSPTYISKRRSARYQLNVPVRIILHKEDAILIRDGRGTELGELGMCVMASLELGVGEKLGIEFTIPYSGEPIRVSSAVRNRDGYRYGCEFIPEGQAEQRDVVRLCQALQIFAGKPS